MSTARISCYMDDSVCNRLQDRASLDASGVKIYKKCFHLPHPLGLKRPSVWFDFEKRTITIEVSLHKFFQGHNVFGSYRIEFLCMKLIERIYQYLGLPFNAHQRDVINKHRIKLGRLDIACSFRFNSQEEVIAALEEIFEQLRAEGRSWATHGSDDFETVYNQKNSKRVTDKFYSKYAEVQQNKIPRKVKERDRLIEISKLLLRYELTFRAPELRRLDLEFVDQWTPELMRQMIMARIDKLNLQGVIKERLSVSQLSGLNKAGQTYYKLWEQGGNLRPHRHYAPLRRARSEILSHGIDIFRPQGAGKELSLVDLLTEDNAYFVGPKSLTRRGAIFGCGTAA